MLNRRNAMIVLLAGGAGLAYSQFMPRGGSNAGAGLPDGFLAANAQETGAAVEVPETTMGDPNAPVTIIEYASFTCPHCASFHADTFKALKEQYIDTGKVHFIYREVYFDRYGLWAGMMARCGGAERYFPMVDILYKQQSNWARGGDPATIAANLKKIGLQSGLDQATVDACLEDADLAQALYGAYQVNAERDNVRSTPSFLINGTMHSGNMPIAQMAELIEAELN